MQTYNKSVFLQSSVGVVSLGAFTIIRIIIKARKTGTFGSDGILNELQK